MRFKHLVVMIVCCMIIAACSSDNDAVNEVHQEEDVQQQGEQLDHTAEQADVRASTDVEDDASHDEGEHSREDSLGEVEDEDEELEEEAVSQLVERHGFELGQMYPTYAHAELWEHADEQWGERLHTTRVGERYIFHEYSGEYVRVVSADHQGWTPLWYFTEEAGEVVDVAPYEMIVNTPTTFSLYPNEEEPYGAELESGKVVQVYKQLGDWVNVRALLRDASYAGDKWIKKQHLTEFDDILAKEGVLILGAKTYDENGLVKEESSGFPLSITGEKENMYSFWAPNGQTGYIFKEDFEPNPFMLPELAMTFALKYDEHASYTVEELTDHLVTLRYFDHAVGAEEDVRTVSFDSMLMRQNGVRLYEVNLWLTYSNSGVQLKPTVELIEAIETDPAFRGMLGAMLGEHLDNVEHNLVITTSMIEQAHNE